MSASWILQPEDDPSWRDQANCRQLDINTDRFFIERGEVIPGHVITACAKCTVQPQCLDYALRSRTKEGYWGGHTPRARRALLRDHLAEHGTEYPRLLAPLRAHGTEAMYSRGACRCLACVEAKRQANARRSAEYRERLA